MGNSQWLIPFFHIWAKLVSISPFKTFRTFLTLIIKECKYTIIKQQLIVLPDLAHLSPTAFQTLLIEEDIMERNKRKPLLHSQVSGFYIPAKFRMNQRHNKHPGKPKVFTRDEIDRYLEQQECRKAQSPREDGDDLARHCGPNFRRFSDYELMQFMPPKKLNTKKKKKRPEDETPDGEAVERDTAHGEPEDDDLNDEDFADEDGDDEGSEDAEARGQEEGRAAQSIGMRLLRV
jgi:hypothetical protein